MPARKFDWDSAWKMFIAGKSIAAIAKLHSVTETAVYTALSSDARQRERASLERRRQRQLRNHCIDCGKPIMLSSTRCQSCNGRYMTRRTA